MDTPLHALAVPDADPATLKRPEAAARELADAIAGRALAREGSVGAPAADAVGRHADDRGHRPVQRPRDARLLVVDAQGRITHAPRSRFVDLLQPGDLVIANDAATLPASLHGVHAAERRRGSKCGWPAVPRWRTEDVHAILGCGLRRGRFPDADRGSSAATTA